MKTPTKNNKERRNIILDNLDGDCWSIFLEISKREV
jgi:hypothetical protein